MGRSLHSFGGVVTAGVFAFSFLFFSCFVAILSAEERTELFNFNTANAKFKLVREERDAVPTLAFTIESSQPISFEVSELSRPLRLAIDGAGIAMKVHRTFPIDDPVFKAVRIASHPDWVRIALIAKGSKIPAHHWSYDAGKGVFTLIFSKKHSLEATVTPTRTAASSTPAAPPTPTPTPLVTPVHAATAVPSPTPTPIAPTPTPTAAATLTQATVVPTPYVVATPAVLSGQEVVALHFDRASDGKEPVLIIGVAQKAQFTLTKSDASRYRLTIPQCRAAQDHLRLPQFPPGDFNGLTVAKLEDNNGKCELTLGVQKDYKILASPRDNEIVVRTVKR